MDQRGENVSSTGSARERDEKRRGFGLGRLFFTLFLLIVIPAIAYLTLGKVVPPNYIGVRQNFWSFFGLLEEGYASEGLPSGLHLEIPGVSRIVLLPRDFQYIEFNAAAAAAKSGRGELEIPTTDGAKVKTDVSIVVRRYDAPGEAVISSSAPKEESATPPPAAANAPATESAEGEVTLPAVVPLAQREVRRHGGPRDLVTGYTSDANQQLQRLATKAENDLKQSLSELSTTDYYNPKLREQRALRANESLNNNVNELGLEVWSTLIRRYWYSEQKIDDQIFAKNLQDQTERLFSAQNRLASAKADTERQRAIWDAKTKSLEVSGTSRVEVLRSEGELYESKKRAEGDLAVASARAQVDGAKATVLAEVQGAEIFVAREMVPLLESLQGGIVTGVDPFDVNMWVDKLTPRNTRAPEVK